MSSFEASWVLGSGSLSREAGHAVIDIPRSAINIKVKDGFVDLGIFTTSLCLDGDNITHGLISIEARVKKICKPS